jgi:hypothetical protein
MNFDTQEILLLSKLKSTLVTIGELLSEFLLTARKEIDVYFTTMVRKRISKLYYKNLL